MSCSRCGTKSRSASSFRPRRPTRRAGRAVEPLAPDTRLLHLQTPRSNRLRFLAGQSVTLGLPSEAGDLTQSIALASCPCDERNLHFHFARDAEAPLAQRLFAGGIRPGAAISVRGPSALLTYAGWGAEVAKKETPDTAAVSADNSA